jgi:hypothetical protein
VNPTILNPNNVFLTDYTERPYETLQLMKSKTSECRYMKDIVYSGKVNTVEYLKQNIVDCLATSLNKANGIENNCFI